MSAERGSSYRFVCASLAICFSIAASVPEVDSKTFDDLVWEARIALDRGDLVRGFEIALLLAETGDIESQWTAGFLLQGEDDNGFLGLTKEERLSEAFRWIATAAKGGHEIAARTVGDSYANGWNGRVVNVALAQCWHLVADWQKKPAECEVEVPAPLAKSRYEEAWAEVRAMAERQAAEEARAPRLPEMVVIPGGRFVMGCMNPLSEGEEIAEESGACPPVELPVREVLIEPFALSKHEVTFGNWDACVAGGGCYGYRPNDWGWGRGTRPVMNVSWEETHAYMSWLSQETGHCYRLPSETEWEYAARAGSTTRYSWGNDIGWNRAHCDGCGSRWDTGKTAPVGSFPPNAFGLHDMHGNLSERVRDCWTDSHDGAPTDGAARENDPCSRRVLRGGAWRHAPEYLRSASRVDIRYGRDETRGFRVARTLDAEMPCPEFSSTEQKTSDGAMVDLPEMVVIPAGRFVMGCVNPSKDADDVALLACPKDELPVREVTVGRFALSKYEVTFANWDACVAGGGCNGYRPSDGGWSWGVGRSARPVINVSWDDAQAYVSWLSLRTGERYRLPSEAEWEYAARAGTTTAYSWGANIGRNRANCSGCGSPWDDDRTAPAGSFAANRFGLHDMHGNVTEWVQDCWNDDYEGAPIDGAARANGLLDYGRCAGRMLRGGSWVDFAGSIRSSSRRSAVADRRYREFGFRVAKTLVQPQENGPERVLESD